MVFLETAATQIIKTLVDWASNRTSTVARMWRNRQAMSNAISVHLTETANWSRRIEFYGIANGRELLENTVPLTIATEIRKFRTSTKNAHSISELEILRDEEDYLILGDPGAGKTTTLKRLIQRHLGGILPDKIPRRLPIVIRLRQISSMPRKPLHCSIANAVGLEYEFPPPPLPPPPPEQEKPVEPVVKGEPLDVVLPIALDELHVLLFVDGLDEISSTMRAQVTDELEMLALRTRRCKIIASMRSGDYLRPLTGFNVLELCRLSQLQIDNIVSKWVLDKVAFTTEISKLPYKDVVDRPLLLMQLALLHNKYGQLPEQPTLVYKRLVGLLLKEWDLQSGVRRRSKYASFEPERKEDFLAALAYFLTYKIKSTIFGQKDLLDAYGNIYMFFGLPLSEAESVVTELETHTGLITVAGEGRYEFSHLSLQEYLAASYLVKSSFPDKLSYYLAEYPAPLAVAVVLSSDPGKWFASFILEDKAFNHLRADALKAMLHRLSIERPQFGKSKELGYAVLRMFHVYSRSRYPELEIELYNFCNIAGVDDCVAVALKDYVLCQKSGPQDRVLHFFKSGNASSDLLVQKPQIGALPVDYAQALGEKFPCLYWEQKPGISGPLLRGGPEWKNLFQQAEIE